MQCGLLGRTLGHSYSPQIHSLLGDYGYVLYEKEPDELESFLKDPEISGLNVTIPYKKAVIPYLDSLSPIARRLGAVNTIIRKPDGKLMGHNTDYSGFVSMLLKSGLDVEGKKVLVLGSGGASNTVVAALEDSYAKPVVISRSGENSYSNLDRHSDASLIVNATPVGMFPKTGISPIDLNLFPHLEGVLDIVYNPARTQLLLDAEARGLVTMNGLWMLVAQAWESAVWFTGKPIDPIKIRQIHSLLRKQMENIVLIGMPGCGKSTIGQKLSTATGKPFLDADKELERIYGVSIPDVIRSKGEEAFRAMETEVLGILGKQSGVIIATGGGCVTRPENYPLLHQNGTIFYLRRDFSKLPTKGRPLSQSNALSDLFSKRQPLYEKFGDIQVDNNGDDFSVAADKIRKIWEDQP